MFDLTIAPQPASRLPDFASMVSVSVAIAYSDELMDSGISVTQECGVIYLDGIVSTLEIRDVAQRIATDVTGAPIRNRLRVAS